MAKEWIAPAFGDPSVLTLVDVDVPAPGPGFVTIDVRAVGMNPVDFKVFGGSRPGASLPVRPGYEVAGVISAVPAATGPAPAGSSTTGFSVGGFSVGDEVLAFRIAGGYATSVTVPAADVFAKPATLSFPEAANLLLAGVTAAEMLHVTGVRAGDTLLVHGASGAVGVSVLQQARLLGARVIGTASLAHFDTVARFGGTPVAYGPGLAERVTQLAPAGIDRALDCVGTDEAVDVSLALVAARDAIVTIAAAARAAAEGFRAIGAASPDSAAYRAANRARLVQLAAAGQLEVPVARTFPFTSAVEALTLLATGHPGGKLALVV